MTQANQRGGTAQEIVATVSAQLSWSHIVREKDIYLASCFTIEQQLVVQLPLGHNLGIRALVSQSVIPCKRSKRQIPQQKGKLA